MIDSVLKGTGNSRFLKSAVPAGTSWADALAMLQAGTFPIDFNGINTEGFQQVGTPLNKANLLKDATAAQIGLPPSTTPDGMFQALGNTGELHVWRKTVKDSAGYTLGSATQLANLFGGNTGGSTFRSSSSLSVSDDGTLSLLNEDSRSLAVSWDRLVSFLNSGFKGKFIICEGYPNSVYYIPQDAEYSLSGNYLNVSKAQLVSGYPADYKTTYPVSTNPNAWQEGDDAKDAGYMLGDATNGVVISDMSGTADFEITTGTAVNVSNDGAVALGGSVTTLSSTYKLSKIVSDLKTYGSGKFCSIVCTYNKQYTSGKFLSGIWYIPSDATMSVDTTITGAAVNLSVVGAKPVTGYAAIPAGTTIEYLGKLGDKARMQVLSYVGTGTYGSSNPNSLTFDFVPKVIMVRDNGQGTRFLEAIYGMEFAVVKYSDGSFVSMIWNKKTVSWYSTGDSYYQMNSNGAKYYAVAIG